MKQQAKAAILEAQAEAALGGHDIGPFEPAKTVINGWHNKGWQAECKLWRMTTWVGPEGLRYSLLDERCPNRVNGEYHD